MDILKFCLRKIKFSKISLVKECYKSLKEFGIIIINTCRGASFEMKYIKTFKLSKFINIVLFKFEIYQILKEI